jgi:hypothetical protein
VSPGCIICPDNIDTYLDNLSSLKIIESQGHLYKTNQAAYDKLMDKYSVTIKECNDWSSSNSEYNPTCELKKGFFKVTELGRSFIIACNEI